MSPTAAVASTLAARKAAVIGGSLGGLAASHALEQSGFFDHVDVFERSPTPMHDKGSGLGFCHVPAWESLCQRSLYRRNQRANRGQGSFFYGDLWGFLYEGLDHPNKTTTVHFGKTIQKVDGSSQKPSIDGIPYDLVVVADGGWSNLRKYVLDERALFENEHSPQYAGYVVWRGSVSFDKLSPKLVQDLQFIEGVYKSGIYDLIVLKMAKDSGEDLWTMGAFIATPEEEVSQYWNKEKDGAARHGTLSSSTSNIVPWWFEAHMATHFGHIPGLVELVRSMILDGEIKPHPQYEFGSTKRVHRDRLLLLGDAAHMASPRTAVGAHTAILDALALRDALKEQKQALGISEKPSDVDDALDQALNRYSKQGLEHAMQLHFRSRQVSQEFVPSEGLHAIESPESIYSSPKYTNS